MASAANISEVNDLFARLWTDYTGYNPGAQAVYDLILEAEKRVSSSTHTLVNDHIALRTFNHPKIGLEKTAQVFKRLGYEEKGDYFFKEKKLYAKHYEHPDPLAPKVFISELEREKFSPLVQKIVLEVAEAIDEHKVVTPEFLWSGRTWQASYKTYKDLLAESEYAAWVYAFGFRCNHFTILFNALKAFKTLSELNEFLKSNGIKLNGAGGEIKGTPKECLEQSSTLAELAKVDFVEGGQSIPACYYEFARRYEVSPGKVYTGFIAASADKIFESTDTKNRK